MPAKTWPRRKRRLRPKRSTQLQAGLHALEKKWALAKERFDLAISERKSAQENMATLERKLQSDRETMAKLRGIVERHEKFQTAAPCPLRKARRRPGHSPGRDSRNRSQAAPPVAAGAHGHGPVATLPTWHSLATCPDLSRSPVSAVAMAPAVSERGPPNWPPPARRKQSSDAATAAESEAAGSH